MAGKTMPTGTVIDAGGGEVRILLDRSVDGYPSVGAKVTVADGVLVERECICFKDEMWLLAEQRWGTCPHCKGSGRDGTYRLVLPDEEETDDATP